MRNQCDKLTNSDLVVLSNRQLQHGSRRLIKKKFTDDRKIILERKKGKYDENEKNIALE